MSKTFKLLDLCCKAGGCSVGYKRAADELGIGLEIVGVDIQPQPNFPYEFIQADAVQYLKENGDRFDYIHTSPPCQAHSVSTARERKNGKKYNCIIAPLRKYLEELNTPAIIENVWNAPIRADVVLRGDMFGLKVLRRRKFELINWRMDNPPMPKKKGSVVGGDYVIVTGACSNKRSGNISQCVPSWKGDKSWKEVWQIAMGIDWMRPDEMSEAIPPAYTHFIGLELFKNDI